MKIDKLVIYGFGKHEDVTIELGPTMNVLYGHNEAGKTTIQQFILHILFGFPARNSPLLRYEPKSGGRYGGQVHLDDKLYGKCIVERVRGKSAGDVTVYFENGEKGEQEALNKLLRQYDRASFESIFAFSLLQLQGFEKMDEHELSRTLLASGTTGVDDLLKVEAKMEREMDLLFKKNGRNPAINAKLSELRTLETQLLEEQRKLENYAPAVHRIKEIDEQLMVLREQKREYNDQVGELTVKRQVLPLYLKKRNLEHQYNSVKDLRFPTDGMERYESILNKLADSEASYISIEQEIKKIEEILSEKVEEEKISDLEQLVAMESEWHRWLSASSALKSEYEQVKKRKERFLSRLGIQTDGEVTRLLQADVSIRKEEEMYELLENMKTYHQELGIVEAELQKLREEIEGMKERAQFLTPPSEEDVRKAQAWPKIRQQVAEAKAYVTLNEQQQNSSKNFWVAILAFTLLIAGYGMLSRQFEFLFISVLISGIAFFLMKRQTKDPKLEEMQAILSTYEGQEYEIETILSEVETYEKHKRQLEENLASAEQDAYHLEITYRELEEKSIQTEALLQSFLAQYGIDGLPSASIIPELFRMIRDTQEAIRQMENIDIEQQRLAEQIHHRLIESERVLQHSIPQEALYEFIRRAYHELTQGIERQQIQVTRKQQLEKELQEVKALVSLLNTHKQALFEEAQVETEEAFYQANRMQHEKEALQEQLVNIELQLAVNGEIEIDSACTDADLERALIQTKKAIEEIEQEYNELIDEKAALVNQTNDMLTDATYSNLQQQFEVERAQFMELARKWASQKALASAIQQMMNDLKEKKFPYVLKEAEQLFEKLTGGQYESMVITEQGYFEVVSKTGMHFPIVELSQATKEQAYISLRLALAVSIFEDAPFPIIMDDPFVHFDESRLSHIIKVLDQLKEHQFIYFTCHEEMKNHWQEATAINVSTIGSKQGANV